VDADNATADFDGSALTCTFPIVQVFDKDSGKTVSLYLFAAYFKVTKETENGGFARWISATGPKNTREQFSSEQTKDQDSK
jgi:hypothetical protein